ncbi:MAG: hypothetical protein QM490_01960 [Candidatus Gracilibacteria bacterium]
MGHRKNVHQRAIKKDTHQENKQDVKVVEKTSQTPIKVETVEEVKVTETTTQTATIEEKKEVVIEVEKVVVNHNAKIKRNLTLSVKNDSDLEALSTKTGIAKSKIVDILLSKFLKLELNDEFDVYDVNISK